MDCFIDMLGGTVDGLNDQPEVQTRLRELLAGVYQTHGRDREWLEATRQALAYHEQAGSDERKIAAMHHQLAMAVKAVHGAKEAEPLLRDSLERHRRLLGPLSRDVGVAAQDLAEALAPSDPEEASELMGQALFIARASDSIDSLGLARAYNGLGNLAHARGDMTVARDSYEKALGLLEPYLGEANPNVLTVTGNLATTLRRPEELPRAEALLRRNLELTGRMLGPRSGVVAARREALGVVLALQGRPDEALEEFHRAAAIQREASGEDSEQAANPLVNAAMVLTVVGQPRQAVEHMTRVRAMEAARSAAGAERDTLREAFGHAVMAQARYEAGDTAGAWADLAPLLPLLEAPSPPGRAYVLAELATVQATLLLADGRSAEAEGPARRALAERLEEQAHLPGPVARHRCLLAASLAGSGQIQEARAILDEHLATALDFAYLTPLQRDLLLKARTLVRP
jgi:tetratricopeptide (TPR) repeat protein